MQEIKIFHNALNDIPAMVSKIREKNKTKNKKIIGNLCSYTPEEIIHAAGFHPMRLFSSKSDIVLAENHLQAYCCSLVRGVLEDSLSGKLDFLDGTVFPHTCDSIQRLSDIWRMNKKYSFFADVVLPVKLNTHSSKNYMVDVLTKFKKEIETAACRKITNEDLHTSIKTFNVIRKNLSEIYELQSKKPGIIKGSDLYALVKGSMIMDRDEVASLLPVIAAKLKKMKAQEKQGKRIIISGSICDSPDIYTAIEDAGGIVVGDDLCTGQRWFNGEINEDGDPISAIADRLMTRIICPAKHVSPVARGENIVSLAKRNKADGVIFMLLKFCDPHAFDYPYLKEFLEKQNIKTILIEIDDQQQSAGQLSTRFETFIHMI
jgi:bcr-type benzoyl-CoA reductase subunit C